MGCTGGGRYTHVENASSVGEESIPEESFCVDDAASGDSMSSSFMDDSTPPLREP